MKRRCLHDEEVDEGDQGNDKSVPRAIDLYTTHILLRSSFSDHPKSSQASVRALIRHSDDEKVGSDSPAYQHIGRNFSSIVPGL